MKLLLQYMLYAEDRRGLKNVLEWLPISKLYTYHTYRRFFYNNRHIKITYDFEQEGNFFSVYFEFRLEHYDPRVIELMDKELMHFLTSYTKPYIKAWYPEPETGGLVGVV